MTYSQTPELNERIATACITLTTENGGEPSNAIYLEPEVLSHLNEFDTRIREQIRHDLSGDQSEPMGAEYPPRTRTAEIDDEPPFGASEPMPPNGGMTP